MKHFRADAVPSRDAIARAVGKHYAPLIAKAGYPDLARMAANARYDNLAKIGQELSALAYRDGVTGQVSAAVNSFVGISRASAQELRDLAKVHGVKL